MFVSIEAVFVERMCSDRKKNKVAAYNKFKTITLYYDIFNHTRRFYMFRPQPQSRGPKEMRCPSVCLSGRHQRCGNELYGKLVMCRCVFWWFRPNFSQPSFENLVRIVKIVKIYYIHKFVWARTIDWRIVDMFIEYVIFLIYQYVAGWLPQNFVQFQCEFGKMLKQRRNSWARTD